MNTPLYVCQTCGRPYLVQPTGNHEEWIISLYYQEEVVSMQPQPPTVQETIDYVLTGEYIPKYATERKLVEWVVAASRPFCPIPECLGELNESYVVTL